jgi:serine/threonine protein kinase
MEYVDGMTLAEWLSTSPSRAQRERALAQSLEVLEYIHSLQLVHHDLKSSNILITRNGQNVKLIDFGLSDTDSTSENNDASIDIQLFGNILALLFPNRYRAIARACQQGKYVNIAALKQAFRHRQIWRKSIPYLISIICVVICSLLLFQRMSLKLREQKILETINYHVNQEISKLQYAADTCKTYVVFAQENYPKMWEETALVRDSIANLYADDPVLRFQCIDTWTVIFGKHFIQFDTQLKQSKSLQ